ncbi:hypothetical protein JW933_06660 [candidate division FCPU426 bacterium]|nr:hypothetical protein [candidate division FCPU426 bacterium]
MKNILISLMVVVAAGMNGCAPAEKESRDKYLGILDNQVYTSPMGAMTLDMKHFATPASFSETVEDQGASLRLYFQDKEENTYVLLLTYTLAEAPPDFIAKLVARAQNEGKNAVQGWLPDRTECLLYNAFQRFKGRDKVVGMINVVFYRKRTIFNITIKSKPAVLPNEAAQSAEKALDTLWQQAVFRGRWEPLPDLPASRDPRLPIIIQTAQQIAARLEYHFELQRTGKPIIRLLTHGQEGRIILSLGMYSRQGRVYYTEAIASAQGDKKMAKHKQRVFIDVLLKELQQQKIALVRDPAYDQDLLIPLE